MSETALKIYEATLKAQHSRNEARRIRSVVGEARRSIRSAGSRWPFELLQNALDFGPRAGNSSVAIRLSCVQQKVAFEHDGIPFTSNDLAALLSGGSSKDYESEVTTGRFGTGFLVTHVLAERAGLRGVLETPEGFEQFDLTINRAGDEDDILQNMEACTEAIRSARPIPRLDGVETARFEYYIDNGDSLALGIESLRSALPYLYATREVLGRVELHLSDDATEVWTPNKASTQVFDGGYVEERCLQIQRNGVDLPEVRVFRFMTGEHASASALVRVEHATDRFRVVQLEQNDHRVYREYPLSGSDFLPTNFVLDGKFEPDERRSKLLMRDEDKTLLEDAFAAAVLAVKFAFDKKWENAHLLVKVRDPSAAFEPKDAEEKNWWVKQLASFVKQVAKLSIVECSSQMLPASMNDPPYADFIVPSLLKEASDNETTVERMWPLFEAASRLLPPRKELAVAWSEIAKGWHSLGIETNRISVKELASCVRSEANTLDELKVEGDPKRWIAQFLDVTGECWKNRSGVDLAVLDHMLPDQNRRMRSPSDLSLDGGIPDLLKDICTVIGLNVRHQLLIIGLENFADENQTALPYLGYALESTLSNSISEEDVISQAVESLNASLPEEQPYNSESIGVLQGSVRLLHYLWESQHEQARETARRFPFITKGQRAVRWNQSRMMMAPIRCWHQAAQPFAIAYPPNRILDEIYSGSPPEGLPNCVDALVRWGIAIADPISQDTPSALTERRLTQLSSINTDGITVSDNDLEFSQIALLQPEVLNRCQDGVEEARALFGLVLCHVAPNDVRWQQNQLVRGKVSGRDVDVRVASALWLADLRIRSWVPISGEDGKPIGMPANSKTLEGLLDPAWLESNDAAIRLLSEWFGFDQLELRLLGIEPDEQKREQLRDGLARLVETGGANPDFYTSLAEKVEEQQRRSRDIEYFRRLGIGVQEAIKASIEDYRLNLELVDYGFDYEVTLPDDVFEDVSHKFHIGPYLLEVKATRKDQVHLTPMQAATASNEAARYVLCVVDLRSIQDKQMAEEWSASIVEPLAKMVFDIGSRIGGTYSLVASARTRTIGLRNDSALRYEVPSDVWEKGVSIRKWVSTVAGGFPIPNKSENIS